MTAKEYYWKSSLIVIILLLGTIIFFKLIPFLSGILGAITIYMLVRGQMFYLTEVKNFRRGLAAGLILLESILCFLVPLGLAVWMILYQIQHMDLDINEVVLWAEHMADEIETKTGYNLLNKSNLSSLISSLPTFGQMLAGSVSGFALNMAVLVLVLYFMLTGSRQMEAFIYDIIPFSDEDKPHIMHEVNVIVRSNAIGIPVLAVIQGAIALGAYIIFKAPSPYIMALLTCFATIIPVVGTGLVWVPLALYMGISGDWLHALLLVLFGAIVISNVDNLIRFMLQKSLADIHPLITILGVFIGLPLFGFMGIIFGPLLLSLFMLCVRLFKQHYLDTPDTKQM
ncbi:MAG: AI-2E family transporter [Tannerellaceae bacterium]|nr:AI-2E family transporter [Tannerellaceae bacterium]